MRGEFAADEGEERTLRIVLDLDERVARAERYIDDVLAGRQEATSAHVTAALKTLDRHDAAAKALLGRRDKRELLELAARQKRESQTQAEARRLVLVAPDTVASPDEWDAVVERELARVAAARR